MLRLQHLPCTEIMQGGERGGRQCSVIKACKRLYFDERGGWRTGAKP